MTCKNAGPLRPSKKKKDPVGQKMKTKTIELAEMLTKSFGIKERKTKRL